MTLRQPRGLPAQSSGGNLHFILLCSPPPRPVSGLHDLWIPLPSPPLLNPGHSWFPGAQRSKFRAPRTAKYNQFMTWVYKAHRRSLIKYTFIRKFSAASFPFAFLIKVHFKIITISTQNMSKKYFENSEIKSSVVRVSFIHLSIHTLIHSFIVVKCALLAQRTGNATQCGNCIPATVPAVETRVQIQKGGQTLQYILIQMYDFAKGPKQGSIRMVSLSIHVQLRK